MDDKKEIASIHSARGIIYAFLSNGFMMQVDDKFYKMLSEIIPYLAELSSNSDISYGVDLFNKFINKKNTLQGAAADEFNLELQRKYTYIMCIPGNVPQEESYYTSQEHILNQESYEEMVMLFDKYNIALSDTSFSYDHIGIELKFMSHLSYLSEKALSNEKLYNEILKEQYNFHINHFDKWINEFVAKVNKSAGEEELLFNGLASVLQGFSNEDKVVLLQLLETVNK